MPITDDQLDETYLANAIHDAPSTTPSSGIDTLRTKLGWPIT